MSNGSPSSAFRRPGRNEPCGATTNGRATAPVSQVVEGRGPLRLLAPFRKRHRLSRHLSSAPPTVAHPMGLDGTPTHIVTLMVRARRIPAVIEVGGNPGDREGLPRVGPPAPTRRTPDITRRGQNSRLLRIGEIGDHLPGKKVYDPLFFYLITTKPCRNRNVPYSFGMTDFCISQRQHDTAAGRV